MNKIEKLIAILKMSTIGILTPLEMKYPALRNVLSNSSKPLDNWRFFMTVGGIVCFLLKKGTIFNNIYKKQLIKADKEIFLAVGDLLNYLELTKKDYKNLDSKTVIGFWVLWAIKEKKLTADEEKELPSVIGNYLTRIVSDSL